MKDSLRIYLTSYVISNIISTVMVSLYILRHLNGFNVRSVQRLIDEQVCVFCLAHTFNNQRRWTRAESTQPNLCSSVYSFEEYQPPADKTNHDPESESPRSRWSISVEIPCSSANVGNREREAFNDTIETKSRDEKNTGATSRTGCLQLGGCTPTERARI